MDPEIIFEEVQGAGNKGTGSLFKLITAVLLASFIIQLLLHRNRTELLLLLLTGGIVSAIISVFLSTRMITQIRKDSIHVRFPPFRPSFAKYPWNSISKVYLRQYDPVTEFGGWGIRFGPGGKAINMSGNIGLQLIFNDGSRLLIGTNQPEKIAEALISIGKLDHDQTNYDRYR
jgi:hypothetical protein